MSTTFRNSSENLCRIPLRFSKIYVRFKTKVGTSLKDRSPSEILPYQGRAEGFKCPPARTATEHPVQNIEYWSIPTARGSHTMQKGKKEKKKSSDRRLNGHNSPRKSVERCEISRSTAGEECISQASRRRRRPHRPKVAWTETLASLGRRTLKL